MEVIRIEDSPAAEVTFTDNSDAVLLEMIRKKAKALEMVGLAAEGYAKRLCAVDTGRLRNSITHTTGKGNGGLPDPPARPEDSMLKGTPEKGAVYIGTNVEYAPYVELGTINTPAQPFLRPAATNHTEQYKSIIDRVMRDKL